MLIGKIVSNPIKCFKTSTIRVVVVNGLGERFGRSVVITGFLKTSMTSACSLSYKLQTLSPSYIIRRKQKSMLVICAWLVFLNEWKTNGRGIFSHAN